MLELAPVSVLKRSIPTDEAEKPTTYRLQKPINNIIENTAAEHTLHTWTVKISISKRPVLTTLA